MCMEIDDYFILFGKTAHPEIKAGIHKLNSKIFLEPLQENAAKSGVDFVISRRAIVYISEGELDEEFETFDGKVSAMKKHSQATVLIHNAPSQVTNVLKLQLYFSLTHNIKSILVDDFTQASRILVRLLSIETFPQAPRNNPTVDKLMVKAVSAIPGMKSQATALLEKFGSIGALANADEQLLESNGIKPTHRKKLLKFFREHIEY
eukprot:263596_1